MASIISAGTTSGTALNMTGDTSGVLQLATNGSTTAVTVDASQNVGIGTTSPTDTSSFGRALDIVSSTGAGVYLRDSTTATDYGLIGYYGESTHSLYLQARDSAGFIQFQTGGTTEQARITSAGLLQFNSGYGSVATAYGCRAWVNFNGTGTVAIRASGNVSSITDNGVGEYTINFTTTLTDANYATVLGGNWSGTAAITSIAASSPTYTTSAVKVQVVDRNGTSQDISIVSASIIR